MDPVTLAAGIGAVSSAASNIFNVGSQRRENRRQRDFTREMYQTQKQDNIDFWNMQNEYNTPAEQMKRFTDAGLNPHLIYGQTNTAAPISSAQPTQGPNTQAAKIDFDPVSEIAKGLNLQMMNEQVLSQKLSNEEKALELADERWWRNRPEYKLEGIAVGDSVGDYEITDISYSGESYYQRQRLKELERLGADLETAVLDQKLIQAKTGLTLDESRLTKLRSIMQQTENNLAKQGIFRGDSVFDRIIMEMTDDNFVRLLSSGSIQGIGAAIKMILDRVIGKKVYRK